MGNIRAEFFAHMSLENVKKEIEKTLYFEKKLFRKIDHDDMLQKGHIFNFGKKWKNVISPDGNHPTGFRKVL